MSDIEEEISFRDSVSRDIKTLAEKISQIPQRYPLSSDDPLLSTIKKAESDISSHHESDSQFESLDMDLKKSRLKGRNDSSYSAGGINEELSHYTVREENESLSEIKNDDDKPYEQLNFSIKKDESLISSNSIRDNDNLKYTYTQTRSFEKDKKISEIYENAAKNKIINTDSNISSKKENLNEEELKTNSDYTLSEFEYTKSNEIKEISIDIQKKQNSIEITKNNNVQPKIRPPTAPLKPIKEKPNFIKNIKKIEKIDKIEKIKKLDNKEKNTKLLIKENNVKEEVPIPQKPIKKKSFQIKRLSSKENHKDLVAKIMSDYHEKEEKYQNKEDELYVLNALEKQQPKQRSQSPQIIENNWNSNTNITKEQEELKLHKNIVKKTREETQKKALDFLKSLEEKLNKNNKKKIEKIQNNEENEFFQEEEINSGDQLLPTMTENKNNEINKNKLKENKPDNKQNEISNEKNEKTWKYPTGEGIQSEYQKTQKLEEKKLIKKVNSLKIKEVKQNIIKKNELLEIEKELQKKQKIIQEQAIQEKKSKKTEFKEKEPKTINVQYIAEKEEINEKNNLEMRKLKKELQLLIKENGNLKSDLKNILILKQDTDKKINNLLKNPKIIQLPNGKLTSFGLVPTLKKSNVDISENETTIALSEMSSHQNLFEPSPLEKLVTKILNTGFSLSQLYSMLDFDGDKLLTMSELQTRLPELSLNLNNEEIKQIINAVDKDSDGVITEIEFITSLENPLKTEKEFRAIIGDLKIENPQIIEERLMDLPFRKKIVLKELSSIKEAGNDNALEITKYSNKLIHLEKKFSKLRYKNSATDSDLIKLKERLVVETQNLDNKLIKEKIIFEEKEKEINENLKTLKDELFFIVQKVIEAKNSLSNKKNMHQKLVITELAFEKIGNKLNEIIEEKNKEEIKNNEKLKEKRNIIINRKDEKIKKKLAINLMTNAIIKIQKLFRGKLDRIRTKKLKSKLLFSKILILKKFRYYLKRKKINKIILITKKYINIQFLIPALNLIKNIPKTIKDDIFTEKIEEKADELMPVLRRDNPTKTIKPINKDELSSPTTPKIIVKPVIISPILKNSKENSPIIEKNKQIDIIEKDIEKPKVPEKDSQQIPATIVIQRKFRQKWNILIGKSYNQGLELGEFENNCEHCVKRKKEKRPIEIICKNCKKALYCYECFDYYHENSLMKNHRFFNLIINENINNYDEKQVFQELANKIQEQEKLTKELEDSDTYENQLVSIDKVEEILKTFFGQNDYKINNYLKILIKKCTVSDEESFLRFRSGPNYLFDKRTKYVDYGLLLGFLSIGKNEKIEN